ncbi:MAG: hypothetical protein K6B40_03055 [Firmicutes bacterium]|nr:hypothetical protein [Bacillota bacterium]
MKQQLLLWRKALCVAVLAAVLALCAFCLPAQAHPAVSVTVNGAPVQMDVLPVIEDGRTLVPVRAISEALQASVAWDANQRKVTVNNGGTTIILYINSTRATVGGAEKQLDVPARIIGGRTMIPLRFISENFGANVDWDPVKYLVTITTAAAPSIPVVTQDISEMKNQLQRLLNEERAKLNYEPVIMVDALGALAQNHSQDMADNGFFSHTSPSNGSLSKRAAVWKVPAGYEFLAHGYPFADKILESWLSGEGGGVLLAENTRFVGFGLARGKGDISDLYAVAEVFAGDGIIAGLRERTVNQASLNLLGWTASKSAPLQVYLLNASGQYVSRQSHSITANGSNGAFTYTLQLWSKGDYKIILGDDSILVHYQ